MRLEDARGPATGLDAAFPTHRLTGQGVVVGVVDSGVDYTGHLHEPAGPCHATRGRDHRRAASDVPQVQEPLSQPQRRSDAGFKTALSGARGRAE
jgi:hypothetical protein